MGTTGGEADSRKEDGDRSGLRHQQDTQIRDVRKVAGAAAEKARTPVHVGGGRKQGLERIGSGRDRASGVGGREPWADSQDSQGEQETDAQKETGQPGEHTDNEGSESFRKEEEC